MTPFDKARKAILDTHANTEESLHTVLDHLEELSELVGELIEAINADINNETE